MKSVPSPIIKLVIVFGLVCISICLRSQAWERRYFSPYTSLNWDVHETYDHGYIFSGIETTNTHLNLINSIIFKTDIDGNLIWKKIIGDSLLYDILVMIHESKDSGLILAGRTFSTDSNDGDPCIIKLDKCGEYEWSVIYKMPGFNDITDIISLSDNNFVVLICNSNNPFPVNNILLKIQPVGDTIWHETSNIIGFLNSLIIDNDSSFVYTGYIRTPENFDSTILGNRAGLCKIDKKGKKIFASIYGDLEKKLSEGYCLVQNSKKEYIIHGFSGDLRDDMYPVPYFLKTDSNGKFIQEKYIRDTSVTFGNSSLIKINDMDYCFFYSIVPTNNLEDDTSVICLDILNENGDLKKERLYRIGQSHTVNVKAIRTFDNKILISCYTYNQVNNKVISAIKLRSDYEQDTFSNINRKYDSLCLNGYNTSRVYLKNARIINLNFNTASAIPEKEKNVPEIRLFPNPAGDEIHLNISYPKENVCSYVIYNQFGEEVDRGNLKSQFENIISVKKLVSGIYIVLINSNLQCYYGKFVKK